MGVRGGDGVCDVGVSVRPRDTAAVREGPKERRALGNVGTAVV